MKKLVVLAVGIVMASFGAALSQPAEPVPVTADNFSRAETDVTMAAYVKMGALGKLLHAPELASIDDQKIVRLNRDTLYSFGVFDLDAAPVTLTLPDPGPRYMMAQVIDQDHYTHDIVYAPGSKTYSRDMIGTRWKRPWWFFGKLRKVEVPIFQRLVLIAKFKKITGMKNSRNLKRHKNILPCIQNTVLRWRRG